MSVDPNAPSSIFVHALVGELPTPDQLQHLDPRWVEPVQAALDATPENRRAALLLAKSGVADVDRLVAVLRGNPARPDRPWPDPVPFDGPVLPSFPCEILPDWLGSFVRAEARATQTPPDLAGLLSLAVLASTLAGRVLLRPWGDWLEPLNLFCMVVLPPGHRKSAVFASVTQPLQQFEADATTATAPHIARARRARHAAQQALTRAQDAAALAPDDRRPELLALVERRADELAAVEVPVLPRLIADDCSPERLAMLLHEQGGRLAILSPEGGIFDLIAGRYSTTGAPNLDHYLKGHAGDPIVVDRVGRPGEIIPRPALTIGLTVQPEVLRGLIVRPGFLGRGLLARFLYAVPNAILGCRDVDAQPVPDSLRADYHRRIRALLALTHPDLLLRSSLPQNPALVLPFSEPATVRLRDFARAVEPRLAPDGDLDPLVDWASKLVGAVARIAGLLHLASLAQPLPPSPCEGEGLGLGVSSVDAAVILADYLIAHARAAYAAMGADPTIAHLPVLLAWLRRSGLQVFSRRDAQRAVGPRLRSAADLDVALAELEQHGYIRSKCVDRAAFGRPRGPAYEVHPSLVRA
ncbi:MAG TPA: YfjI family protein [Chloroflexota bacterium]|nr:YfjI family protein [Chloroflexota bacterium]